MTMELTARVTDCRTSETSLRIAIVTETWAPNVDGVVTRLANTVDALRETGHQVLVVAPTSGGAPPGVQQTQTRSVSLGFVYGGKPWGLPDRSVTQALAEFRPDVVHVVNPVCMGAWAARSARRRYPLVTSYHTNLSAYASHYHLGWLRPALHYLTRWVHGRADVRLATSETGRQQLASLGVDEVGLWARGVDRRLFRPGRDGSAIRERIGVSPQTPVALCVGRLALEKGCERLLEIFGDEAVHLVFVGDGPDRRRLEGLFAGMPASFLGTLHGDDLADAYAAADVFVFPSTTDTLGLVVLEAMASGLPIAAVDTPGNRQLLSGHCAARLVGEETPGGFRSAVTELGDPADRPNREAPVAIGDWVEATVELVERYRTAIERRRAPTGAVKAISRNRRLSRFAGVGVANAAIDLAVFNILILVHPTRSSAELVVYNTFAVTLALANSYLLNSRWTFRDSAVRSGRQRRRRRILFALQSCVNLGINDLAILVFSMILSTLFSPGSVVTSNLSKVGAMVTASASSYALMRLVVFRPGSHAQADQAVASDRR
jgi:glycosyltransferase involved in cell wall biosynthesis/putative flippase GtrA